MNTATATKVPWCLLITSVLATFLALISGCDAQGQTGGDTRTDEVVAGEATSENVVAWKLPKALREISGLASDGQGLVYAVADERAHVFHLNPHNGDVESVFGLGEPTVKGDFEGIALHDNRLYLITSKGRLLSTRIAEDGASARFDSFLLETRCKEIEGLATEPETSRLWLVCKELGASAAMPRDANLSIRLEAWSIARQTLIPELTKQLPLSELLAQTGQRSFKPSGLEFVPAANGADIDLLIISGAQRAYGRWRWADQPQFLAGGRLPKEHRQPEGIAAGRDGTLLIADEGAGKRARLRVYPSKNFRGAL